MNKNFLVVWAILLFLGINSFTVVTSISTDKQSSVSPSSNNQRGSFTLITETGNNRVIEVDNNGTIIWQKSGLGIPVDAERLKNGNTLIVEFFGNRVIEVDTNGTVVWQKTGLSNPSDAERLENGNTLITDYMNYRVIEVNTNGTIVWQKEFNWPYDAERLENGNTLVTDYGAGKVIEIDTNDTIVWQITGLKPSDAERLENGNTLIAESSNNRVIEVDNNGTIIWQITGLDKPYDAERLENGNILLITKSYVIEVDSNGTIVWEKTGLESVLDVERYSNEPPGAPVIDGPHRWPAGKELCFTFHSTDPDGGDVKYIIDWGDGNTEETDYYPSCTPAEACHTNEEEGTYIIKAMAEDIKEARSDESSFEVEIPRTRSTSYTLFHWFLERFPLLEKLLSLIRVI